MTKPAGLTRFARVITTKRDGTCKYCGGHTAEGRDHAAVSASGAWTACCVTCGASIAAQVAGMVAQIEALAANGADVDISAIDQDVLETVLTGSADETTSYNMLVTLAKVQAASTPVDPTLAKLQEIAADPTATARDREFAASLAQWLQTRGSLSPGQQAGADKMLARRNGGTKATAVAPGLYMLGNEPWLVRKSRGNDRVYANRLGSTLRFGTKPEWVYVKGGLALVAANGRPATIAEIKAIGDASHFCCYCGEELTDDRPAHSQDRGYGPKCAQKHGLPWG